MSQSSNPLTTTGEKDLSLEKTWRPSLLRRLTDAMFGYDFFISYTHSDGRAYATELARRLESFGFNCFLDSDDYRKGDDWKRVGYWTLRCTSRLVLVGSPNVHKSRPVLRELQIFCKFDRQIIPICFEGSLNLQQTQSALVQLLDSDRIRIPESLTNLQVGPSELVVKDIRNTFNLMRQSEKRVRVFAAAAGLFAVLLIMAMVAGWFALQQRDAARKSLQVAQQRWAASLQRPMGRDARIDPVEWASITELTGLKKVDEPVRLEFLRQCLSTAPRARQLRDRMELIEHALFVEDRELRIQGFSSVVLPRLAELEHSHEPSKLEMQFACVELGVAMNAIQFDQKKQFAQHVIRIICVDIEQLVASYKGQLSDAQATNEKEWPGMAIGVTKIARTDGAFVVRMIDDIGTAMESIAPTLDQQSAAVLTRQLLKLFSLTLDPNLTRVTDLDDIGAERLCHAVEVLIPILDRTEIERTAETVAELMKNAATPSQLLGLLRLAQAFKAPLGPDQYQQLCRSGVTNFAGLINKGLPYGTFGEWHQAFRNLPPFMHEGMSGQAANDAALWILRAVESAGSSGQISSDSDQTISVVELAEELVGLAEFLGAESRRSAVERAVALVKDSAKATEPYVSLAAASKLLNSFLHTLDKPTSSQTAHELAMYIVAALRPDASQDVRLPFSPEELSSLLRAIKPHLNLQDLTQLLESSAPLLRFSESDSDQTPLGHVSILIQEIAPQAERLVVERVSATVLQRLPAIAERLGSNFKLSENEIAAIGGLAQLVQPWISKADKLRIAGEIVRILEREPENTSAAPVLFEAMCEILGPILPGLDPADADRLRQQATTEDLRTIRQTLQSPHRVTLADSLVAIGLDSKVPQDVVNLCSDLVSGQLSGKDRSLDLKAAATVYRLIAPSLEPQVKLSFSRLVAKTINGWPQPQRDQVAVSELDQLSLLLELTQQNLSPKEASGATINVMNHVETLAKNASNIVTGTLVDVYMRHASKEANEDNDRIAQLLARHLIADWQIQLTSSEDSWQITELAKLAPQLRPAAALDMINLVFTSAVFHSRSIVETSSEGRVYLRQFDRVAGVVAPLVERLDPGQLKRILRSPACVGKIRQKVLQRLAPSGKSS